MIGWPERPVKSECLESRNNWKIESKESHNA